MKAALFACAAAACSSPSSGDVVGPFSGAKHRYAVDHLALPQTSEEATAFGDDLDGDTTIDNQLGVIFSALITTHDASTHGDDMIAAGVLASSLVLQSDSLEEDDAAGATYFGHDGDAATVNGGRIHTRGFISNRTVATMVPGAATILLPVFADADPVVLPLTSMELDLVADGNGGFDGLVRGGIAIEDARAIAYGGVGQMMVANPTAHLVFARILDTDHDGNVTTSEIMNSSLLGAFLVADLQATMSLSVGFSIHLVPCDTGPCLDTPPADRCHDRQQDSGETDVDCGGPCLPCPTAATCGVAADCQSNACDTGHCRAPTCSDGARDGFESDVDCGAGCVKCQVGRICANNMDCLSNKCAGSVASTGTCTN